MGSLVAGTFAGWAANGWDIGTLLDLAVVFLLRAMKLGLPLSQALAIGANRLLLYATTEVADTGRIATQVAGLVEPEVAGYERIVHLPACGRCIILAGRLYRYSTGFLRHPRCDCTMKPVSRAQWRSQRPGNEPRALFEAMSPAQQDAGFGAKDAAAIRAGADIARVVNAHRSLYVAGGRRYTHDATTRRGLGRQLAGQSRPTAAQLVTEYPNRDELIPELARFGYLSTPNSISQNRSA